MLQCGFVRSNFDLLIGPHLPAARVVLSSVPVARIQNHARIQNQTAAIAPGRSLTLSSGAGDGNRTPVTSLEGWGSTLELHPQLRRQARLLPSPPYKQSHADRRARSAKAPEVNSGGC